MIFSRLLSRLGPGIRLAAVLVAAVLGAAPSSMAGLDLISSSGTSRYFVSDVTTSNAPSNPLYIADLPVSTLIAPGAGLPSLTDAPLIPNQFGSQSTLANLFPLQTSPVVVSDPRSNGVPTGYGTGFTQIYAETSGQSGGTTTQGGIFWSSLTSLATGLSPGSGMASVSVSTATAMFTYSGPPTPLLSFTPGAILNVSGTVDTSIGGFVAAGLATSITLSGPDYSTPITVQLAPITLAGTNTSAFGSSGTVSGDVARASISNGNLTGTGVSYNPNLVYLGNGDSITLNAVLTLISGPGSSIQVLSGIPPDFDTTPIPIGVYDNAPPAIAPEPSTILLLGAGLAMAGLWSRSSRRRTSAGA